MSQHDLTIDNQGFPAFRADLNNALQALGSTQSGTSAPSPTFANQLWYDTTNNQLKIRNEDNDAWITIVTLDQSADVTSGVGAKTLPTGDLVGTSDSQTLTNKTINASQLVDASVTSAKLSSTAQYTGFKNRIQNGGMVIDQRNAGASVTVNNGSSNFFISDRWFANGQNTDGVYTGQQVTTAPVGFNNSLQFTVTTADASIGSGQGYEFRQRVEGYNIADFGWGTANAKTVTLSFWVRSSLTGTFGGSIFNSAANRAYVFSYAISVADTWEYKTVTIAGDTSGTWLSTNGTGLNLVFSLGAGSSLKGSAGSWGSTLFTSVTGSVDLIGTNGATFYITGVQLEVGSTATSFDYRPYGTELALCQRYYQKTWNTETAVGTGNSIGAQITRVYNTDPFIPQLMTRLPVVMRATPTVTGYDTLTGAVNRLTQAGVSRTISNIFDTGAGASGFPQSATNPTSGDDCRWHFTASAEL